MTTSCSRGVNVAWVRRESSGVLRAVEKNVLEPFFGRLEAALKIVETTLKGGSRFWPNSFLLSDLPHSLSARSLDCKKRHFKRVLIPSFIFFSFVGTKKGVIRQEVQGGYGTRSHSFKLSHTRKKMYCLKITFIWCVLETYGLRQRRLLRNKLATWSGARTAVSYTHLTLPTIYSV